MWCGVVCNDAAMQSRWARRHLVPTAALLLVLIGAGCSVDSDNSSSRTRSATTEPDAAPQPWTEVTDGTWNHGDFGLGQPNKMRLSDHAITITGPPTLTTSDGGATVRMTSPIRVERVQKPGDADAGPISKSEFFSFQPGFFDLNRHDEVYGNDVVVNCDREPGTVGEVAQCTISFVAQADEIQNSYWLINRSSMAAWPGQHP